MSTIIPNFFSINGVIDTSKSVLENMNKIAEAVGCWITYDIHQGQWAVVINSTGSSVATFNDSNIIGGINLTSTSLTEVYNSVEMEFPNKDLTDEPDVVKVSIPSGDRYPNEPDNVLSLSSQLINNPAQARLLASIQLKQSRMDKVITFTTDYSKIGLKAGDLISVTNTPYGFSSKMFRIISISEDDGDDGTLVVNITALEYSADVYSTAGLVYDYRTRATNIPAKRNNSSVVASDNRGGLPLDLSNVAKSLGLLLTFNALTGRWELSQGGQLTTIAGTSAVITWTFDTGQDLDIRCRIISPSVGQIGVDQYLGWTGDPVATNSTSRWPLTGTAYIIWGGDNTGTGSEAVAVNIDAIKAAYPTQQYIVLECRGNWYVTPGSTPVKLTATIWQGGTFVGPSSFTFTNPTATKTRFIEGLSVFVDSNAPGLAGAATLGDLMGYFVFDTVNNTAQFRNDLTGLI